MKKYTLRWVWTLLFVASSSLLLAQPPGKPKKDEKARDLVSLARKYYRTQQWMDAALTYELASQRPYNDLSTYSVYMAGMSFFQLGEKEKALDRFEELLKEYPKSKYVEDSRYHKALILMESPHTTDREKGLDQMFGVLKYSRNGDMRSDIQKTIRHYLFNVYSPEFNKLYQVFAPEEYKIWFTEALCYQMDQKGEVSQVQATIAAHEESGKPMTDFLASLKEKYEYGHQIHPNRLRIAVFVSLHLDRMDTATVVPAISQKALEMVEGMKIALDSTGKGIEKQVVVQFFDTQGNPDTLKAQLDSLERFGPDIVVGDIRSALANPLAEWAEEHHILHFIPRNPFAKLIQDRKYSFLTHPSLPNHGEQMARYAYERTGMRKFVVFNDGTPVADEFTKAFKTTLDSLPGTMVTVKEISRTYEENRKSVPTYVKTLKNAGYDAVYIPLSSEESAGLIISQLNFHKVKIPVLGGPDWEVFSVIDPELKSSYELRYSSFYHEKNDSVMHDSLSSVCLQAYGKQPSQYTVQGYDLMAYVLHLSNFLNPFNDAAEVVRTLPPYRGIHQDMFYGGQQSNQKINVIQFQDGRTKKVNWDIAEQGVVPDGEHSDPGGG